MKSKQIFAGILPFATYKNEVYFLLGKEVDGMSDFGGGIEKYETPLQAAAREGFEESLGILGKSPKKIEEKLKSKNAWVVDLPKARYYFYKISYNTELPAKFKNARRRASQNPNTLPEFSEKTDIIWVKSQNIFRYDLRLMFRQDLRKMLLY